MRNCEYCGQTVERVIQVGDFVQRFDDRVGLVSRLIDTGNLVGVHVVGDRGGNECLWYFEDVSLIHGTLRITERL